MKNTLRAVLLAPLMVVALALAAPTSALAQGAPKVAARLVSEDSAVAPGGKVTVALEEKITDGWHTYWINPGDAGAPSEIHWTLPPGWSAGSIQWPTPKRLAVSVSPDAQLMDYGYEGTLWLLSDLTVPATAKPGDTVTLKAAASWLVCRQICIPEDAALSLDVKVGAATVADASVAKQFAETRAKLPVASPWKLAYAGGANLDLYAAAPALVAAHPKDIAFFPLQSGAILNPAPQRVGFAKDGVVLRMAPGARAGSLKNLQGVLVLTSSDGSIQALNVDAPVGAVPAVDFPAAGGDLTLLLAIAFAFVGGLILNVMPCVLPILAMKALALASMSGRERREATLEAFSYSTGVVLSFAAFGIAIVVLRELGNSVGWGFQLQEPLAVAGFALLVFAVGMNLTGLFEVGSVTAGEGLASKGGITGAFFTGVLAVAVAAPCTAPFMAPALGFALTQSPAIALTVFVALGLGFALPFLILGVWPKALSFLPRPGPWMIRLKQILSIPMYGWAIWMGWVLYQQTGRTGLILLGAAMAALLLAVLLWRATRDRDGIVRMAGIAAAMLLLVGGAGALTRMPGSQPVPVLTAANAFTQAKLDGLRAHNKPVFVDATAAWCITCLVNEQAVLSRPDVKTAFASKGVTYLVADWTNRNEEITRLLTANDRSGVPLYLYFAPGSTKPVILPQILTQDAVLAAINS